jgi:hydrogenase/urease accessory protein HupE
MHAVNSGVLLHELGWAFWQSITHIEGILLVGGAAVSSQECLRICGFLLLGISCL